MHYTLHLYSISTSVHITFRFLLHKFTEIYTFTEKSMSLKIAVVLIVRIVQDPVTF